jgi:hypothetical protein
MLHLTTKYRGRPPLAITITDRDGNVEHFTSTKEAALRLSVNVQTIYNALHSKKNVRGCKIVRG